MSNRIALVAVGALALIAVVPTAAQAAPHHSESSIVSLVLPASGVGPGYVEKSRADGVGVAGYVTLDLCGFSYHAEQLRTDRRQVNYAKRGSKIAVSNEVVSYVPGGTVEAFRELGKAIAKCPVGPVVGPVAGGWPERLQGEEVLGEGPAARVYRSPRDSSRNVPRQTVLPRGGIDLSKARKHPVGDLRPRW